ncbi:MAG: hypothetical protein SangKO_021490 [Sandaracinaceae bacterium]
MYLLRTVALLCSAGCDGPAPLLDAGEREDAEQHEARVEVRLELSEEGLPSEWEVDAAQVWLAEVRADNDRGSAMEPVWTELGELDLRESAPSATLDAAPATYGGVTVRGAEDVENPTFALRFRVGDEDVEVVSRRGFEVMARCEGGGLTLRPGELLRFDLQLDLEPLATLLAAAALPPPTDGTRTVDEASAPDVLERAEEAFDEGWRVDCEGER